MGTTKYKGCTIVIEPHVHADRDDYHHPNSLGLAEWEDGPEAESGHRMENVRQWISVGIRHQSRLMAGFEDAEEFHQFFEDQDGEFMIFPVYGYSHSGYAFSLAPFSCPWDSGRAGDVAIRIDERCPDEEAARKQADIVVKHFEDWFNGEYYGWRAEHNGAELGSCYGYLVIGGDESYMIEEAKETIDYWLASKSEYAE